MILLSTGLCPGDWNAGGGKETTPSGLLAVDLGSCDHCSSLPPLSETIEANPSYGSTSLKLLHCGVSVSISPVLLQTSAPLGQWSFSQAWLPFSKTRGTSIS